MASRKRAKTPRSLTKPSFLTSSFRYRATLVAKVLAGIFAGTIRGIKPTLSAVSSELSVLNSAAINGWKWVKMARPANKLMPSRRSFRAVDPVKMSWSGREDLNLRHPAPKAGALPDCATPRSRSHIPYEKAKGSLARLSSDSPVLKERDVLQDCATPRCGKNSKQARKWNFGQMIYNIANLHLPKDKIKL